MEIRRQKEKPELVRNRFRMQMAILQAGKLDGNEKYTY